MDKEFIPYEEALALKEMGFEPFDIFGYYYKRRDNGKICALDIHYIEYNQNFQQWEELEERDVSPLYQQAFRWFREKHNLVYTIGHIGHTDSWTFATENLQVAGQEWSKHYSTYEEAELECLKQLIKIVKEKK
jgi:hypothetical protein